MNRESRNKALLKQTWNKYMDVPSFAAMLFGVAAAVPVLLVGGLFVLPLVLGDYLLNREWE